MMTCIITILEHIALISNNFGLLPRTLEEFQQTTTYLIYTYRCNKINMGKHWPTYLHHKSVSNCYVSHLGKGKTVTGMSSREMQQHKKHRQGSRMNTDQFLKWAFKVQASREVWSRANHMLDFNSPKSFPGFLSHSERILARFQLGKSYFY